ncbi:hypothetical protein GCM10010495_65340 [Kitasatospora herbaricolor]|uniref:hypothetical protein n=1 Tax=Kitasatospora herbaricolor TaxID=68217 RepID=UPI00174DF5E5|nr:hypothetical protein [Kitasatospora herbaricolor]MDQ0313436.1 hypothetical protein [Kitasatospora herbaricolor]GGV38972.1 hypothetical protein GCM10010495_65340 [Kitasatospora herbaricolor]
MDAQVVNELVPVFAWIAAGAANEVGRDAAQSSASRLRQLMRRRRERGNVEGEQPAPSPQAQQEARELIRAALVEEPAVAAELDHFHAEESRSPIIFHVHQGAAFGDNHGTVTLNFNGAVE